MTHWKTTQILWNLFKVFKISKLLAYGKENTNFASVDGFFVDEVKQRCVKTAESSVRAVTRPGITKKHVIWPKNNIQWKVGINCNNNYAFKTLDVLFLITKEPLIFENYDLCFGNSLKLSTSSFILRIYIWNHDILSFKEPNIDAKYHYIRLFLNRTTEQMQIYLVHLRFDKWSEN